MPTTNTPAALENACYDDFYIEALKNQAAPDELSEGEKEVLAMRGFFDDKAVPKASLNYSGMTRDGQARFVLDYGTFSRYFIRAPEKVVELVEKGIEIGTVPEAYVRALRRIMDISAGDIRAESEPVRSLKPAVRPSLAAARL